MHQQAAQATWNPERDLWETDAMDLFSGLSDVFSETLPISGMTRSGRLFLRPQSVPLTVGNGSSSSRGQLFRTPCAAEAEGGPRDPNRPGATMRLSDQVREETEAGNLLPTPRATRGGSATETVELLPTPAAYDGMKGGSQHPAKRRAGGHQPSVADVVEHLLPTPCASPSGNTPEEHLRKKPGRERVTDLSILVENDLLQSGGKLLPTPTAMDSNASGGAVGSANVTLTDATERNESRGIDFGQYADAIARWETVTARSAPAPTELTAKGKHRLSARFVEWMMGQSDGWVTDEALGLSRVQQLRALGNGVVTQQAVFAINWLLERAHDQTRTAA